MEKEIKIMRIWMENNRLCFKNALGRNGNMTKQEAQELFDYLKKENIVDCECIQQIKEVLKR
jgi:hypothetical protein